MTTDLGGKTRVCYFPGINGKSSMYLTSHHEIEVLSSRKHRLAIASMILLLFLFFTRVITETPEAHNDGGAGNAVQRPPVPSRAHRQSGRYNLQVRLMEIYSHLISDLISPVTFSVFDVQKTVGYFARVARSDNVQPVVPNSSKMMTVLQLL